MKLDDMSLYVGETPTYQMNEHCNATQDDTREMGRVTESGIFENEEKIFEYHSVTFCKNKTKE